MSSANRKTRSRKGTRVVVLGPWALFSKIFARQKDADKKVRKKVLRNRSQLTTPHFAVVTQRPLVWHAQLWTLASSVDLLPGSPGAVGYVRVCTLGVTGQNY